MLLTCIRSERHPVGLRLATAIGAVGALVGVGCAAPPVAVDRVSVAELGVSSDAAIYIGIEKGYFAAQHIEVDRQRFGSPIDILPGLTTGRLDVGSGAPTAGFFNALARGIPLKIVASNQRFEPGRDGGAIVIRTGLAGIVHTAADLKGKRLGIVCTAGVVTQIYYNRILSPVGLSESDVDLVVISGLPDLLVGLENGTIDAAALAEPVLSRGLAGGEVLVWKHFAEIAPGAENNLLVYSAAFAERGDVARRFMLAWIKAARFYNDALFHGGDRDGFFRIMSRYTSITDPVVYQHMSFSAIDPDGRVDIESLSSMQGWYATHG